MIPGLVQWPMQTRQHEFAMQVMSLGLGFQVWQSRNEISTSQHPWRVHRVVIQLGHLEVNDSTETAWQEGLHESIFSGSCCICHTGYVHVRTWRRPMRWRAFSPRDFGHFHGQRKGRNPTGNAAYPTGYGSKLFIYDVYIYNIIIYKPQIRLVKDHWW